MEPVALINDKYYMNFIPTKSAQAMHKACSRLYYSEDMFILGRLGNGHFASVFLVHHRPTNQLMAVKLSKEVLAQRREVELLSRLNHENVIKLYGSCVVGARFACLTEPVNGGNLADLLSEKQLELPWSVRIGLALDIAKGLHHLHSNELIHRDLSSVNIFIRVELSDSPTLENGHSKKHSVHSPLIADVPEALTTMDSPDYLDLSRTTDPRRARLGKSVYHHDPPYRGINLCTENLSTILGDDHSELSLQISTHKTNGMENGHPSPHLFTLPTVQPFWKSTRWSSLLKHPKATPHYTAVVADLGLCLDLSQEHTNAATVVGNPFYIAPERLNGVAPYTFAADVFSYGVVLCELITRAVNDGTRIPRTQDFGLDHTLLHVPAACPHWFLKAALDACIVDHTRRPALATLISRFITHCGDTVSNETNGVERHNAVKLEPSCQKHPRSTFGLGASP